MRAPAALLAAGLLAAPGAGAAEWQASYPEGPVWIGGTLYWAEMGADSVMAWDGRGEPRVFLRKEGCGPTAVAPYRSDEVLVLCHLSGSLIRVDGAGRALAEISGDAQGNRLRDPNDASADGAGGVWFTDPGAFSAGAPAEGAIWHLAADGTMSRHVTGLSYGNGIFVDRPGGRLLVSEHLARRVLSYPLETDGLGAPQVLVDFAAAGIDLPVYPEAGPDGLEVAPDGTLWVAEYGAGRLHAFRGGLLVKTVEVAPPYVTNVAFGPEGQRAITGSFDNTRSPFPGVVEVRRR